jgi:hypothetical protein
MRKFVFPFPLHALAVLVVDTLARPVGTHFDLVKRAFDCNRYIPNQSEHEEITEMTQREVHASALHLSGKRDMSAPAGVGANMLAPYWNWGPSPERSGKRDMSAPVGAGWYGT